MYHAATPAVPVARFKPNAHGLDRWFGPTEARIMDVMWNGGAGSYTVKKMWREITETYRHDVAYTTIMTTMSRLYEKGVLQRAKTGLAFVYAVRCTQAEYEDLQISAISASLGIEANP